jgi:hypothetical protein
MLARFRAYSIPTSIFVLFPPWISYSGLAHRCRVHSNPSGNGAFLSVRYNNTYCLHCVCEAQVMRALLGCGANTKLEQHQKHNTKNITPSNLTILRHTYIISTCLLAYLLAKNKYKKQSIERK